MYSPAPRRPEGFAKGTNGPQVMLARLVAYRDIATIAGAVLQACTWHCEHPPHVAAEESPISCGNNFIYSIPVGSIRECLYTISQCSDSPPDNSLF